MIFHSRISENKVQSYITIAFYERVYYMVIGWVNVLLHWLVLGREAAITTPPYREKDIVIRRRKPAQAASGFG